MTALMAALRQVALNRSLRHAELAWFISAAAQWAYFVSVLVFAYDFGGVAATGLAGTLRMLPAALAAPFTNAAADRLSPRNVLCVVALGRGATVAGAAVVMVAGLPAWLVFAAIAVEGIIATLNRPTHMALMPAVARSPEELVAANATTSSGEAIGVLIGPALGGLLMAIAGPTLGVAAGGLGLFAAALVVLGIESTSRIKDGALASTRRAARLLALMGGFTALRRYPAAGTLVALFAAQTFVRGALTVLLVAVSVELLLLGSSGVGYLNAAIGAGSLLGAFVAFGLVLRTSLALPASAALALWGIPIAILGIAPLPGLAFVLMGIVGVANAVLDVSGMTLMQRVVPNRLRARVFGAFEAIASLTAGVGSLVAPLLVSATSLEMALIVTGALLPILALLAYPLVRRADASAVVPLHQLTLLRGVPMFAPLPLTTLEQVATSLVAEHHDAAADVISQGDPGDCWYLIAAGSASVIHDGERVATLTTGDSFGEIALLSNRPRTATVRADDALDLFRLPRPSFLEAVTGSRHARLAGDSLVSDRLAELRQHHDASSDHSLD